jgi:hypothetical protein
MTLAHRSSRARVPALSSRLAGAFNPDQFTGVLLATSLVLSLVFAGVTASRMIQAERAFQPALEDTRRLAAALEATRVQLRDGRLGAAEPRIARADSQAQRFHRIASASRSGSALGARMLAYDAAFGEYYVAAHRAAAGISMSADADGSSAEDAALGYATLRKGILAGLESQTSAIAATRPATAPVEVAGWLSLALLSAAALFRRSAARSEATRRTPSDAPRTDRNDPVPAIDAPPAIPLHEAVERLARKRLAASVAAAKVAKRNNERQVELARTWYAPAMPMLSIVPAEPPMAEMDVYEDEPAEDGPAADAPMYRRLALVTA